MNNVTIRQTNINWTGTDRCPSTVDTRADGALGKALAPRTSAALGEGDERTLERAGVDLARAAELAGRVAHHLPPLRDPAGQPAQREQHREHLGREAQRL